MRPRSAPTFSTVGAAEHHKPTVHPHANGSLPHLPLLGVCVAGFAQTWRLVQHRLAANVLQQQLHVQPFPVQGLLLNLPRKLERSAGPAGGRAAPLGLRAERQLPVRAVRASGSHERCVRVHTSKHGMHVQFAKLGSKCSARNDRRTVHEPSPSSLLFHPLFTGHMTRVPRVASEQQCLR